MAGTLVLEGTFGVAKGILTVFELRLFMSTVSEVADGVSQRSNEQSQVGCTTVMSSV